MSARWRQRVVGGIAVVVVALTMAIPIAVAAPSDGFYENVPSNLGSLQPGHLIKYEVETDFLPALTHEAAAYRVMYRSTGQLGQAVAVTGMVFVPQGSPPAGGWPIVAWNHGTSGVGDQCAPSRWPDLYTGDSWDVYLTQVDRLLAEGYLVTATDYEGLGTPGLHPYLQTDSLGRAVIDGVRAARELAGDLVPAVPTQTRWAAIGHSEGGQAAIGAGELAAGYSQGLTLVGAAAYAPSQHIELGIEAMSALPTTAPYLAYFAVGMKSINANFNYANFVGPIYRNRMGDAEEHCFDEWFGPDNQGVIPTPLTALNPLWLLDPTVRRWISNLQVGQRRGAAPVFVMQGGLDLLVVTYGLFVNEICRTGTPVDGQVYPLSDHDAVVDQAWPDARNWLRDRFAGVPPSSGC